MGNEHQSSAGGIFDQLIVPYDRVQLGIAQAFCHVRDAQLTPISSWSDTKALFSYYISVCGHSPRMENFHGRSDCGGKRSIRRRFQGFLRLEPSIDSSRHNSDRSVLVPLVIQGMA